MSRAKIDGEPTSFKCDADLRAAMLEEFGKQGMAAYLRRIIRRDMEERGRVPRRDRARDGETAPPTTPACAMEPDSRPVSRARPSTSPTAEKPRSKKSQAPRRASDPRYNAWMSMKQRIPAWDNFLTFVDDMGIKPPDTMLLRHNKEQPHGPENSFWGTVKQRNRALPRSKTYPYRGRDYTLLELSEETGLHPSTLSARLRKGASVEQALSTVVRWGGPGRTRPRR